jgi:hypothetical protein
MDSPHLFLAMTNPAPGMEDEFNRFYDEVHCDDVIGSPGWVAVQRYKLADEQRSDQSPPWKYMAVYEIDLPDGQILAALSQRPDVGPHGRPSPLPWANDDQVWIYSKYGPRHVQRRP